MPMRCWRCITIRAAGAKYQGFGRAVNITLGLPFIRTSVDHGTALELAGTGTADVGSFRP